MIPNVIPILYCMGAWGLLGIPIDLGSAIIASIVIGIAADDTIHFVTRFNKELVLSQDFNTAMSSTFRTCGRALFYTTMTLSLGFSIFMLSSFGPLKNGGRLSVPPVIVAFVADMIIFPALLLTYRPGFMKKKFFI
jgi:predicted RND superfamily exporter protein